MSIVDDGWALTQQQLIGCPSLTNCSTSSGGNGSGTMVGLWLTAWINATPRTGAAAILRLPLQPGRCLHSAVVHSSVLLGERCRSRWSCCWMLFWWWRWSDKSMPSYGKRHTIYADICPYSRWRLHFTSVLFLFINEDDVFLECTLTAL